MENRIRELRKKRKMTMKQLGEVLDLAESTISQYETGKRQPDNDTLCRISEFFGVTIGCLLGVEEETPAVSGERALSYDDFTYAMQHEAKDLTNEDKDLLLSMARQLKAARQNKGS